MTDNPAMLPMNDSELDAAIDALDYMFQEAEPFKEPPDEEVEADLQEFVDFMGFHPGTLHQCYIRYLWFHGDVENPAWLGEMSHRTDVNITFETEPEEPFIVADTLLLAEAYGAPYREDTYCYYLKILVRDKVAYAPIPIGQIDENVANHFKSLFSQIVTDR